MHEFSLHLARLPDAELGNAQVTVLDEQLAHRVTRVLRLKVGETLFLFDKERHAYVKFAGISGKKIIFTLLWVKKTEHYQPPLIFLLPLLHWDDCQQAVDALVQMGVTTIQLVITKQIHRNWWSPHHQERLSRVCIASAEQAKNFAFPTIKEPIALEQVLQELPGTSDRYFFDPTGDSVVSLCNRLSSTAQKTVVALIGPEADLTSEEKHQVIHADFVCIRLTPTILRAYQAAALAAGLVRSLTNGA